MAQDVARPAPAGWAVRAAGVLLAVLLAAQPALAAGEAAVEVSVRAAPIIVRLELSQASSPVGKAVTAKAIVTNAGSRKLTVVTVTLRVDLTGLVVAKSATSSITQLKGGKTGTVQWSVCGRSPGAYLLFVRAGAEGVEVDSPARLLVITPAKGKC